LSQIAGVEGAVQAKATRRVHQPTDRLVSAAQVPSRPRRRFRIRFLLQIHQGAGAKVPREDYFGLVEVRQDHHRGTYQGRNHLCAQYDNRKVQKGVFFISI
jgi:hypothetical protein